MTPERQAEIEVLGSLDNPVQNNDTAVFRFVCEAKRGIRELLAELATARQQAGDELEHITYPPLTPEKTAQLRAALEKADLSDLRAQVEATLEWAETIDADRDQLRQRAEAAEARVKHLDDMLEMLPEYLEYWDACDGPALSLSEWYTYRDGYQE